MFCSTMAWIKCALDGKSIMWHFSHKGAVHLLVRLSRYGVNWAELHAPRRSAGSSLRQRWKENALTAEKVMLSTSIRKRGRTPLWLWVSTCIAKTIRRFTTFLLHFCCASPHWKGHVADSCGLVAGRLNPVLKWWNISFNKGGTD